MTTTPLDTPAFVEEGLPAFADQFEPTKVWGFIVDGKWRTVGPKEFPGCLGGDAIVAVSNEMLARVSVMRVPKIGEPSEVPLSELLGAARSQGCIAVIIGHDMHSAFEMIYV